MTATATIPFKPNDPEMANRPPHISPEEWAARVELAACYRIFDHLGWIELIYNHITLRLAGPDHHFLINPFGLFYKEVTASNLVKVDIDGNIIGKSDWPINPAGFTPHAAIHRAVPDAHCVMHTHTTAGMAVANLKNGLEMTNFYACQFQDALAYHDFEGVTTRPDEGARMVQSMGNKRAMILRSHGLLVAHQTIPAALFTMFNLQRACEVQIATNSLQREVLTVPPEIGKWSAEATANFVKKGDAGQDMFKALKRLCLQKDPSFLT